MNSLIPRIIVKPIKFAWRQLQWFHYFQDWRRYSQLPEAEPLLIKNAYPQIRDRTSNTGIDPHYFYQSVWAAQAIHQSQATTHVDVGSHHLYVGMLTAFTKVTFVDIRPLLVTIPQFTSQPGTILNLPFDSDSVQSISCLHVAEHIGLGRYGDPLDPLGTQKSAQELARVLAKGGNLYFSLPIGRPRVQFNAHRIHSPRQILDYFKALTLTDFAVVTDDGTFLPNANPDDYTHANYACGLFHFSK